MELNMVNKNAERCQQASLRIIYEVFSGLVFSSADQLFFDICTNLTPKMRQAGSIMVPMKKGIPFSQSMSIYTKGRSRDTTL